MSILISMHVFKYTNMPICIGYYVLHGNCSQATVNPSNKMT